MNFQPILQQVPTDPPVASIGEDRVILNAFKGHAGLPTDPTWTELDYLLKSYLAAAEKTVDRLTGCPYQKRSYSYQLQTICRTYRCWVPYRYIIRLPVYPVSLTDDFTIEWTSNTDSGIYELTTDFSVFGESTLHPEIVFPKAFVLPATSDIVYPFKVLFSAGPCEDLEVARTAIFELAAHYYRNPESMSDEKPNAGGLYMANLDLIANNFL